jgi:uncharacterized membrane protein
MFAFSRAGNVKCMPDITDITKSPKKIAAAGAAMMALPLAAEGIAKLTGHQPSEKASELAEKAKDKASAGAKEVVGDVADEKIGDKVPDSIGGLFGKNKGGSGSGSDSEEATEAHGSGRRMPIQQSVDVAVPIEEAYDGWTRFEDWPRFMHRVDSVQQVDDSTVHVSTKVWGITKEFEAEIVEQRPEERIEWHSEKGLMNSGVVTFHSLAPRLTRIEVTMDVKPDSLLEKAGRGMRFTKRAVRGDLHRFKAYVEMEEQTDDGWRGTIKDGDVKKKTARKSNGGRSRSKSRSSSKKTKSRR